MENNKFKSELDKIERRYSLSEQEKEKDVINIFSILHKERDEKHLHSRFISWLLSPDSNHKQTIFLENFLEIVGIKINLENVEVFPKHDKKEYDKKEYEDIDILIINRKSKQAIIIENKIDADDQPYQLANYYKKIKSILGENAQVFVRYLTLYKEPSIQTLGSYPKEEINFDKIYYWDKIKLWLEKCLENSSGDLYNYIQQYYILIKKTAQTQKYIEIKQLMAKDLQTAKKFVNNSSIKSEDFGHIKWHTIHEFWVELKKQLRESKFSNIQFTSKIKENIVNEHENFKQCITKLTDKEIKVFHGLTFEKNNIGLYIVFDCSNDLSWGIQNTQFWKKIENIDFNFSTNNTFQLINRKNMENAIKTIIDEIATEQKNHFQNLKKQSL